MKLTDVSVEYRASVYVFTLVLIVAGFGAYVGMPREAAPEIDIPVIVVSTPYIGVSPTDIESLITQPMERELKEVKNVKVMRSTSAEGAGIVTIEFDSGTNLDEALQEVREKVDLAAPNLPADAEEPIIKSISTSDFPMMIVNITGSYSIVRLRQVAESLQDDIEVVKGVLDAKLAGGVEREIQVRVDAARLNHYGIGLPDVSRAIDGENVNMPGGNINVGDAAFLVRVPAELESAEQISNIVVKMRGDHPVYVRDLATVRDTFKDRETISRLDGRNNVSLTITKRPGANLLDMAATVKQLLHDRQPSLPAGTEIVILGDESLKIKDMVKELENNILTGLVLVIGVIMLAMGLRNSVLVGIAIPLSMLLSFLILDTFGITLNMIVLFSLIIALGMLVDNAIVIVENIYRHASEGKGPFEAALVGAREVAWPVTTSTATTVMAFLPLMFWPGIMGDFMGYLPLTLIVTLSSSLFVALVINPVFCAAFLRPTLKDANRAPASGLTRQWQKLSAASRSIYEVSLRDALAHRPRTLLIGAAVFVGTFVVFVGADLGVEFFPEVAPRKIFLDIDAGDGSRLKLTDRIVQRIEDDVLDDSNIEHYVADVGSGGGGGGFVGGGSAAAHKARISIDFIDRSEQAHPVQQTIDQVRSGIAGIAGARIELQKEDMGPPGAAPITIEVYGDDFHQLGKVARTIRDEIKSVPNLVDLKDDYQSGRPELRIEVDRERAKLLRAEVGLIASTIRTAINGTKASVLRDGDDEYDVTVRLDKPYRERLADVEALRITVKSRTDPDATFVIPVGEVARIVPGGGTGSIRHKDLAKVVTIEGNTEGRLPSEVLKDVQARLDVLELPAGYSIGYAGEDVEQDEAQAFLSKAFLSALFLIGLVLVTQFNSIFVPAVIMLAVVLSLIGVFWGQIILQLPFGVIMTGLGVISLAGVVVNNGIVLVDYVQLTRASGVDRTESLVLAGLVRLRPVLLTAVTTILGLLPMAFGVSVDFATLSIQRGGQSAEFWHPMAVALIFGLAVATVLTLVVVPVLYSLLDDVEAWLSKTLGFRKNDTPTSKSTPQSSHA